MDETESKGYLLRRAEEERAAAEHATDDRVAQAHRELAEEYERRASGQDDGSTAKDKRMAETGTLSRDFRILP